MGFDNNHQYTGTFYGKDRLGFTTPSPDASDGHRPWLVVPYPAPWLPQKRRDEGHPVAASIVFSDGHLTGLDKSGGLIPAGLFSGNTGAGGDYCLVQYNQDDVGFTYNPQTGLKVVAAGEYALLACPNDANTTLNGSATTAATTAASNVVTFSAATGLSVGSYVAIAGVTGVKRILTLVGAVATVDSNASATVSAGAVTFAVPTIGTITPTTGDVTFAKTCDLVPGGGARAIGYIVRNAFQYIGGVNVISTTGGMLYTLDSMNPTGFSVHNYMHEMGVAVQTHMVLRLPWIGANTTTLQALANTDGVVGYTQTDFSRSFVHFTGAMGNAAGQLFQGSLVVPSTIDGRDAGNYMPFNPVKHTIDQVCGRVIGIESQIPVHDFADRVRTQFDRANSFVGPFSDKNPNTFLMGGSATRGQDYQVSLTTGGVYRYAYDQAKTLHPEYATYIYVHVKC